VGNELGIRSDEDHQEQRGIYLVTDGLKSHRTRISYDAAFKEFLKVTVRNDDLQALVDTKISVIEAKIIAHIEYLRDVRKLAYRSINVYCSGIFHFFEMNDISLNRNKIKRFLPSDDTEHNSEDRSYSIEEISRIIDKCDIRSQAVTVTYGFNRYASWSNIRAANIRY
jgi:hypothetical protein